MVKGGEGGGIGAEVGDPSEGGGMGCEGGPVSVDKDKALGAGAGSRLLTAASDQWALGEPLHPSVPRFIYKDGTTWALPQRVPRSYSK